MVPVVLTVAGSDSGGGAGIQADLKTFSALGVFGTSAITALTAQNTRGVSGIHKVPSTFLKKQLQAVLEDFPVQVIKTGMLPDVEAVEILSQALKAYKGIQLVVDPVLIATCGDNLADSDVGIAMKKHLFPLATVVTPNLPEAEALLEGDSIKNLKDMEDAAQKLHSRGPQFVLIKGGHLEEASELVDVIYDGHEHTILPGPRIKTGNTHGTGCTLASAIAAYLARGLAPPAAIKAAKGFITEALRQSTHLHLGRGSQKPLNHSFRVNDWRPRPPLDLRVYVVTDPTCNAKTGRSNAEAVNLALEGGATIVQLREKNADGSDFCREASAVLDVARRKSVIVLINDRIDVALATGADGVHLGQDDIPAETARRLLGPQKILGVSVKTVDQARKAEAAGADYLGAGAMYSTPTKDSSRISHETLAAICKAVQIPVVAIGGIKAENAASCLHAGCAGVAIVSAIFGAADPSLAARHIRNVVDANPQKQ